jgi:hypothetical protein
MGDAGRHENGDRLFSKPPQEPFLANPETGMPEELLPPSMVVLTKANIEKLAVQEEFLESDIVITHQPKSAGAEEDIC